MRRLELSQEEREFLERFRKLSEDDQKIVFRFYETIENLPDNYDRNKVAFFLPREARRAIKIHKALNHEQSE